MRVSHDQQRARWDEEHANPFALTQMDSQKASGSLAPFVELLAQKGQGGYTAIEMGCGKGRNVIWLAGQPLFAHVTGFDFSEVAIAEARRRAEAAGVFQKVTFDVADATEAWPYPSAYFDVGLDCTATVDIESPEGREAAVAQMHRVLRPGGLFLIYAMSTDDEYHKEIIAVSPANEPNAFVHPKTGKFEKVYSEKELDELCRAFTLVEARRIPKVTEFFGKQYQQRMHWRVYRK